MLDFDYKGHPYTAVQKKRIVELGNDPVRGFRSEEGEAGLAAEEDYGLKLTRYPGEGLEFTDQNGSYWDVISPPSISLSGRPAFRLNRIISSIKSHLLKGNVILDYGRLNDSDKAMLQEAIKSLTDREKKGRTILVVRTGE